MAINELALGIEGPPEPGIDIGSCANLSSLVAEVVVVLGANPVTLESVVSAAVNNVVTVRIF